MMPKIIEQRGNDYYATTLKRDGSVSIDEKIEEPLSGSSQQFRTTIGVWNPKSNMSRDVFEQAAARSLAISECLNRNARYAEIEDVSVPNTYTKIIPRSNYKNWLLDKEREHKHNHDKSVAHIKIKFYY